MKPPEPLLVFTTIAGVLYASIFVHELGHAVMGRIAGYLVTSFGMGLARPWCVLKVGRTRIYFGLVRPLQGLTFAFMPRLYPSKGQLVVYIAGGILANGTLTLVSLVLLRAVPYCRGLWVATAWINGTIAVFNLLPFHFRVGKMPLRSDGALIVQALRSYTLHPPAPMTVQSVRALRGLLEPIGDLLCLRASLSGSAAAWVALGDPERAERDFSESELLAGPVLPPQFDHGLLIRATIRLGAGRLSEAAEDLDAAEARYRELKDEAGLLLVASNRAILRMLCGDAAGAADDLEALSAHPLVGRLPELAITLLVERAVVCFAAADDATVENLSSEFVAARLRNPSSTRDLRFYTTLARSRIRRSEGALAEASYRQVVAAIAELAAGWIAAEDRTRFLQRHTDVLTEARDCLTSLGKSAEAEAMIGPLLAPEGLQHGQAEAELRRDGKFRRLGWRITLVNLLTLAGSIGLPKMLDTAFRTPFVILAITFVLCGIVQVAYIVFYQRSAKELKLRRFPITPLQLGQE